MRTLTSGATYLTDRILGEGQGGAQKVELADGLIEQTLDMNPVIRRGRTFVATEGIYVGQWVSEHVGGGTITTTINPYGVGAVGAIAPFPPAVDKSFDLWALHATVRQVSGTGTATAALLAETPTLAGFSLDNSGGTQALTSYPLATWLETEAIAGLTFLAAGPAGTANVRTDLKIRLPRILDLSFRCAASAAATWVLTVTFGKFPAALGQDVGF